MFVGVCGGIAKYFDVDPTLVRVLFVIFGLAVGSGLLAYIVLAIIMPLEPADYVAPPATTPEPPTSDDDETEEDETE
jgi:phage shock protein C